MSEADEVALALLPVYRVWLAYNPANSTIGDAIYFLRACCQLEMSVTFLDNVAESLYCLVKENSNG